METTRHSWSGKNLGELTTSLRSRGFEVKEQRFPKPDMRIGFKERIEVVADKCKAFLDPYVVLLDCKDEPTEKDKELRILLEKEYSHRYSFERAVIYPALLALAIGYVLRYLG